MNATHNKYKDQGLIVLGLSHNPASLLDKFVEEFSAEYPIISAPEAKTIYGVSAFPTYLLVSTTGKILVTGHASDAQIEAALESVIQFPEIPGKGGKLKALRKACANADILGIAKALSKVEQDNKLPQEQAEAVKAVRGTFDKIVEATATEIKSMKGPDYFADVERLTEITKDYKGLPVAEDAKVRLADYKKDKDIKREIAAMKSLHSIRGKFDPRKSSSKKKIAKALKGLIKKYSGTLAATKAEQQQAKAKR